MHVHDLATDCPVALGPAVRAIGWLEGGSPFPTGNNDPVFARALASHAMDHGRWLPVLSLGVHFCDLGTCRRAGGDQYVVIPSTTCVYVAPELVSHYVEEHRYTPPDEFVAAVLACPEQSSDAYVELLLPFAGIWRLTATNVRTIAKGAVEGRRAQAAHKSYLPG